VNAVAATNTVGAAAIETVSAKPGQVRYDEGAFRLEMLTVQSLKVGETGAMTITLSAKPPFHVNAEYPHRFKISSTKAAKTPSSTVNGEPAKTTPSKLELSVPLIPVQVGEGELEGELSFSVCTAEKCLMEKRQLKASFVAK
jgi:hypothetical protein